jgi:hypothetical protein
MFNTNLIKINMVDRETANKIVKKYHYMGTFKRMEHEINASGFQPEEGGAVPTHALQQKP